MAVKRSFNWLGQGRVDVPHLRLIESSVAGDFDALAGYVISGKQPLVAKGFKLDPSTVGSRFENLKVVVADSAILHYGASESGTVFTVPATQAAEQLTSTNSNVVGSFVSGTDNFVGVDLVRQVDNTTQDRVAFLNADTVTEQGRNVPLGRVLEYRFVISTRSFSSAPNVCPIAIVSVDTNGFVTKITDARRMFFRLGSGGDVPAPLSVFAFSQRKDSPYFTTNSSTDPFSGGDKDITSLKSWQDSIMTRLWEIGGGEYWYSQTAGQDVSFVRDSTVAYSTGDNFEVVAGNVHWKGVSFTFANSTATLNNLADQPGDSLGLTDLSVGECVYVDLDRSADRIVAANWVGATVYVTGDRRTNGTNVYECVFGGTSAASGGPTGTGLSIPDGSGSLVWKWVGFLPLSGTNSRVGKTSLSTVGSGPAGGAPGSRYVLAWRTKTGYFARGNQYQIGTVSQLASTTVPGLVYMSIAPALATNPTAIGLNEKNAASGVAALDAGSRVTGTGLTRNAAGVLTVGDQANDTSVAIGKTGANTNVLGTMSVQQLLSLAGGLDSTAGALTIGSATATSITIGKAGLAVSFPGGASMGSAKITSVQDPGSAQDAATKNYVDTGDNARPTSAVLAASTGAGLIGGAAHATAHGNASLTADTVQNELNALADKLDTEIYNRTTAAVSDWVTVSSGYGSMAFAGTGTYIAATGFATVAAKSGTAFTVATDGVTVPAGTYLVTVSVAGANVANNSLGAGTGYGVVLNPGQGQGTSAGSNIIGIANNATNYSTVELFMPGSWNGVIFLGSSGAIKCWISSEAPAGAYTFGWKNIIMSIVKIA